MDRVLERLEEKETAILASQTRSYEAQSQIIEMLTSVSGAVNGLESRIQKLEKADIDRKDSDQRILRMLEQISQQKGAQCRFLVAENFRDP